MDKDNMELADLLKRRQISLELNMNEFARYIGVSRQWLCRMYSRTQKKQYVNFDVMGKLVKRLNIPISVVEKYNFKIIQQRELEKN